MPEAGPEHAPHATPCRHTKRPARTPSKPSHLGTSIPNPQIAEETPRCRNEERSRRGRCQDNAGTTHVVAWRSAGDCRALGEEKYGPQVPRPWAEARRQRHSSPLGFGRSEHGAHESPGERPKRCAYAYWVTLRSARLLASGRHSPEKLRARMRGSSRQSRRPTCAREENVTNCAPGTPVVCLGGLVSWCAGLRRAAAAAGEKRNARAPRLLRPRAARRKPARQKTNTR